MSGADHAVFVWSAYGATAIAIGALVIRALIDGRAQVAALRRLEAASGPDDPSGG